MCHVSRCRSGAHKLYVIVVFSKLLTVGRSRASRHMLADAPQEARQFTGDCHADLVVLQPAGLESSIAMVQT